LYKKGQHKTGQDLLEVALSQQRMNHLHVWIFTENVFHFRSTGVSCSVKHSMLSEA